MQDTLKQTGSAAFLCGENTLFDHDRVIFTQNNRMAGYVNGEMGQLEHQDSLWPEDKWIVRLLNRAKVSVMSGLEHNLALAYAITIHRAQGSVFDTVLLPLSMRLAFTLNRNMLYTAITRAKKQVILVGDIRALDHALAMPSCPRRTMLVQRVKTMMNKVA